MTRKFLVGGVVFSALFGASSGAIAEGPHVVFSGFATLGVARSNSNLATFVSPGQASGATRRRSWEIDSKVGLQGMIEFSPQWSAAAQILSKQGGDGDWSPEAEWLFVKYKATPRVALRAGRIGLPVFALSDVRHVNFAHVWVRPPLDVYGQVPFSHFNGTDLLWQIPLGDANVHTQLFYGQSTDRLTSRSLEADSIAGFNITADWGEGWRLRLGHSQATLSVVAPTVFPPLLAGLRQAGFSEMAEKIDPYRKAASFSGLGLSYDGGGWIASAEYTLRRTRSYVSDSTGWFASLGHRWGPWTPYVTLGERRVDDSNFANTIPVTSSPSLETLRKTVDGLLQGQLSGQKTQAIGLRWDAVRNTAVKLQLERIRYFTDRGLVPAGAFINLQPGFSGATVLSISVDVIF